jgi:hypothetical protein
MPVCNREQKHSVWINLKIDELIRKTGKLVNASPVMMG